MTNDARLRDASRRLVLELVVVVLLAGLPIDFPRSISASGAWSFLLRHPSELSHALMGTLILVEAVALLTRTVQRSENASSVLAGSGLAFVVLAVSSGATYVSVGQPDAALTAMTAGWVCSLVAYGISWRRHSRALRVEGRSDHDAAIPSRSTPVDPRG